MKKIKNRLTYAYIRRIKKWMICPSCKTGKMRIDKKTNMWACNSCGYMLSNDEFKDDYVFWFCDECATYLNIQEGFDRNAKKHICKKCGYENDTTFDNIKGICSDCGKLLTNPDVTLCQDCKKVRIQKTADIAITIGVVAGAVAVGIATASNENDDNIPLLNTDDVGDNAMINISKYTDYWFEQASLDELESEREIVRSEGFCNPALNDCFREECHELLYKFDDCIRIKRYGDNDDWKGPAHTKHGWYLSDDD